MTLKGGGDAVVLGLKRRRSPSFGEGGTFSDATFRYAFEAEIFAAFQE